MRNRVVVAVAVVVLGLVAALVPLAPAAAADRPVVYLTFDDGPSADGSTGEVLDLLAAYGIRATFFVSGRRAAASPDGLRRLVAAGHAVANHTYDHPALTRLDDGSVLDQLARLQDLIVATTGVTPTCYRPPYGDTNARVAGLAGRLGLTEWKWTRGGADYSSSSAETLRWLRQARDGDVILLHDGPTGRSRSVAALRTWLAEAAGRFEFRVLPGCGVPAPLANAAEPWLRPEFQLRRLYAAVFGRVADPGGYAYWTGELLQRRQSLPTVAEQFARSSEFATLGLAGDEAFVTYLYGSTLGRAPDPEGFAYWVGRLRSGTTRGAMILGFSESAEFLVRSLPLVTGACAGPDVAAAYRCAPV